VRLALSSSLARLGVCAGLGALGLSPSEPAPAPQGDLESAQRAPSTTSTTEPVARTGGAPFLGPARPLGRTPPLRFFDPNVLGDTTARLFDADDALDEGAVSELDRFLWRGKEGPPRPLSRRLVLLVAKAAVHFGVEQVTVVSSHRDRGRLHSRHRTGEALDFALPGVPPRALAEHLRTNARVGVGVYVHPRTQYVHLDVRDESYHWIDGTPPGRGSWGAKLGDPEGPLRDRAWQPEHDLPRTVSRLGGTFEARRRLEP
jgi:uncharacterized protein YcbK (DUF882 family)